MQTFEQFRDLFSQISDDIKAQYVPADEDEPTQPMCHILHRELNLGETRIADAEKQAEKTRAQYEKLGLPAEHIDVNNLDFTEEHAKLHDFVRRYLFEAKYQGVDSESLAMALLTIGRRIGLREAAQAFGDLGDVTGPSPSDGPAV